MKTILITGATSGIGYELLVDSIKNGYKVYATSRNIENLKNKLSENNIDTKNVHLVNMSFNK